MGFGGKKKRFLKKGSEQTVTRSHHFLFTHMKETVKIDIVTHSHDRKRYVSSVFTNKTGFETLIVKNCLYTGVQILIHWTSVFPGWYE